MVGSANKKWLSLAWAAYLFWIVAATTGLIDLWKAEAIRPDQYLFEHDPRQRAFLHGLDVSGRHRQMLSIGLLELMAVVIPGELMLFLVTPLLAQAKEKT